MIVLTPLIGIGSVLAGLAASCRLDLPSGPCIVAVAGLAFLAAWARVALRRRVSRRRGPRLAPHRPAGQYRRR